LYRLYRIFKEQCFYDLSDKKNINFLLDFTRNNCGGSGSGKTTLIQSNIDTGIYADGHHQHIALFEYHYVDVAFAPGSRTNGPRQIIVKWISTRWDARLTKVSRTVSVK